MGSDSAQPADWFGLRGLVVCLDQRETKDLKGIS